MNISRFINPKRGYKCVAGLLLIAVCGWAQTDPGPRGGPPAAGNPISGLTAGELSFFNTVAAPAFAEVEAVANGLAQRFNLDSCGGCRAFPALGGSSPA